MELKQPKMVRASTKTAWKQIIHTLQNPEIHPDAVRLCQRPLEDPDFCCWAASAKQHHCRIGGLLEHTEEVLLLSLTQAQAMIALGAKEIDLTAIAVACIWHDYMKTRDYCMDFDKTDPEKITVAHHPYHGHVHHIAGGYASFVSHFERVTEAVEYKMLGFNHVKPLRKWMEKVGHILLSHHGRIEWHSPVEPRTLEALIMHQADSLSARYDREYRKHENSKIPQ
jgi:3'-5' exoribonuclease